jgi:hypothetical protein
MKNLFFKILLIGTGISFIVLLVLLYNFVEILKYI